MAVEWKKLQNGSDIRGVAVDGVPGESVNLTKDVAETIASSFVFWLSKKTGKMARALTVAVGTDSRISGPDLKESVNIGITKTGACVVDCGMASTPAMFMATVLPGYEYDGSVMITASHLPFNRNGLKFFTKDGGLEKADITEILNFAAQQEFSAVTQPGKVQSLDLISIYASDLVSKIRKATGEERPLSGFKIVVDAGNGAGGFFAEKVLQPLGALTDGSQFLEPDGMFPNHIPNPEDSQAMAAIQKAVLAQKADFGIIFDTDVDRAGAVDCHGREINRNRIIALISAIAIEEHPGATIVTDSITSSGLKKFIEDDLGGIHHRFKRGYKNVINEAIRLNKEGIYTPVAIETSGHGALKENYFLDDGAYLISKILIKMAQLKKTSKTIDSLIENLEEPAEAKEYRMHIFADDFKDYGASVIKKMGEYINSVPGCTIEPNNYEGIRVSCDSKSGDGWFLLRMSLHDPLMPLNIESNSVGGVDKILKVIVPFLKGFDQLETNCF